jgi:1-aminocyclopropane-1-carboxylate deaminase
MFKIYFLKTENQFISLENSNITLAIKREDLIHPFVSGNKYRKLKYNLVQAKAENKNTLLTFGGAYSNHIAAVAFAGKENNFKTIGIIRGKELKNKIYENPTLKFAQENGMKFEFTTREAYKNKDDASFLANLKSKYGNFYLIPEGGSNDLAVKGCEEILTNNDSEFDYICTCVGTSGTIAGIMNRAQPNQKILGFSALKGVVFDEQIHKFAPNKNNWKIITDYHFGGYAKVTPELITFINAFYHKYKIPLDPIYTGKLLFGVIDLINKNYFPENSKILVIHTGGIQGIEGMNLKLKSKNLLQINVYD